MEKYLILIDIDTNGIFCLYPMSVILWGWAYQQGGGRGLSVEKCKVQEIRWAYQLGNLSTDKDGRQL